MDDGQNFDPPAAYLVSHDIRHPGNHQFADSCHTARSAQAGVQAKALGLTVNRRRKLRCGDWVVLGDELKDVLQVGKGSPPPPQREAGFCHRRKKASTSRSGTRGDFLARSILSANQACCFT